MSDGKRLRIGVVGLGRRGQEHLETLAVLTDRFELAGVCDVSDALAQQTAVAAGVKGYSDLKTFFADSNLDVVVIASSRDTHHTVAKAAGDHRVNMLIETPLAQTRRLMDLICETVDKSGVKAEVGEQMWRRPPDRMTKMVIDAGLIGKVLRTSSYYDDAGDNSVYHTMSRMRVFVGSDVVQARGFTRVWPDVVSRPGGDGTLMDEHWTQAEVTYENGVLGSVTYVTNWTFPLRAGHPRFCSVEGTDGFVVTGNGSPNMLRRVEEGRAVDYPLKVETKRIGEYDVPQRFYYETNPPIEWINPYNDRVLDHPKSRTGGYDGIGRAYELDSIHRAVTENVEPVYGLQRARRDQELSVIITEAARLDTTLPGKLPSEDTVWEAERHEEFRQTHGSDPFAL